MYYMDINKKVQLRSTLIKWTVADGTCTMTSVSMTIKRGAIATSEIKQLSLTAFILLILNQSTSICAFRRIKAAPFIKCSVHPWHVKTWPYEHMSSVRPVLNKRIRALCNDSTRRNARSTVAAPQPISEINLTSPPLCHQLRHTAGLLWQPQQGWGNNFEEGERKKNHNSQRSIKWISMHASLLGPTRKSTFSLGDGFAS